MVQWEKERAQVLETCLKLTGKGLVIARAGNVSVRCDTGDSIAITPTSRYYDSLTPADLPIVKLDGTVVDGRLAPSSEIKLHLAVYQVRPDVQAIIHTHSLYASAVAVSGQEIPPVLEEEVMLLGGAIRVAPFALAGTQELADNAVVALGDRAAVILANHGAVGVGADLREAFDACELLEKSAAVYLLASAYGKVNLLPAEAILNARAVFARNRRR
jgi:ribulose-5-phosphate 4-epimerase/fuculose-1-phosphate aldolase